MYVEGKHIIILGVLRLRRFSAVKGLRLMAFGLLGYWICVAAVDKVLKLGKLELFHSAYLFLFAHTKPTTLWAVVTGFMTFLLFTVPFVNGLRASSCCRVLQGAVFIFWTLQAFGAIVLDGALGWLHTCNIILGLSVMIMAIIYMTDGSKKFYQWYRILLVTWLLANLTGRILFEVIV